jgi:hypothetical protein
MNFTPNILLLSATIADICTTLFGLGIGAYETNPLVATFGWAVVLVGKLGSTLFVVSVLRSLRDRLGGLAFIPGLVVSLFVIWNLLILTAELL